MQRARGERRLGGDEPGEEGAEGDRETNGEAADRDAAGQPEDREQEELARLRLQSATQNDRHDHAAERNDANYEAESLTDCDEDVDGQIAARGPAAQLRDDDEQRHRDQILDERDRQGPLPITAAAVGVLRQHAHEQRRAGKGDRARDQRRRGSGESEADGGGVAPGTEQQGRGQRLAAEAAELVEGELETDREEQQRDAELPDERDVVDVVDDAENGGPDEQAAADIADDERHAGDAGEVAAEHAGENKHDEVRGNIGIACERHQHRVASPPTPTGGPLSQVCRLRPPRAAPAASDGHYPAPRWPTNASLSG